MLKLKGVVTMLILVYGILGINKAFEFLNKIENKVANKNNKKLEKEIKELREKLEKMEGANA